MKKLLFFIGMLIISTTMFGQWSNMYRYNDVNVIDYSKYTKEQLTAGITKAAANIKTGKLMTGVGGLVGVIGFAVYRSGLNDITSSTTYSSIDDGLNKSMGGLYIGLLGATVCSIGIPIWYINYTKKENMTIELIKFKSSGQIPINTPGLKLTFNF